jgi:hypothetical protein
MHWRAAFFTALLVFPGSPSAGAPASVKSPSALEAVPPGERVLSVFEPSGAGCQWRRVDVQTKRTALVAEFPVALCRGARVAWASKGTAALVWFDPRVVQSAGYGGPEVPAPGWPDETPDPGAKHRAWVVTPAIGPTRELPILPAGDVEELGLDPSGAVLALTTEPLPAEAVTKGRVSVDGERIVLDEATDGIPALAHAWRLDGHRWVRVETAQTTTGWDLALGARALQAFATLGLRSITRLIASPGRTDSAGPLPAALTALAPKGDGAWTPLGQAPARAFVWTISAEFAHTTGLVAFEVAPGKAASNGFTAGELVAHRVSGPWLLSASDAAGTHPRLFSLKTGTLRWSSDTARGVTIWP